MQQLGVGINLSKSVVSNPGTVVEFAKRTSVKGVDVSAISLKMLEAATDFKSKVQVALYLGLKTGLGVITYFKALYALGPSALFENKIPTKAVISAEARILSQLVQSDNSNLISYLASNIDENLFQGDFTQQKDIMYMSPEKANRIVSSFVRGEDVVIQPTLEQSDIFEYLSHDLKLGLCEQVIKAYTDCLDPIWMSFPTATEVLLSP